MTPRPLIVALAAATVAAGLAGCSGGADGADLAAGPAPVAELLAADLGGDTTRNVVNQNAFGLPAKSLPGSARADFEVGDSFFTQNWVIAPASTTSRDGLGPNFNATACAGCHTRDGRASPPTDDDPHATGLLLRLSVEGRRGEHGAPAPDADYGGQLQDQAIPGVTAEGTMAISRTEVSGSFADGSRYTLEKPSYSIAGAAYGDASSLLIGPRIAPSVIGMGLLEAVPDATVRAAADPGDRDGDGISGRVNTVWDAVAGHEAVGRFGWKANVATIRQQTAGAYHGDMGISSPVVGTQDCTAVQVGCAAAPTGGTPEIDDKTFDAVVFYTRVLSVPAGRDDDVAEVRRGAAVFEESGCASCHTPTLRTGDSDIGALANQTIHPFTDLLLHDMGPGLADGRPDFEASGSEWRTPPLWGIGLVEKINGHTRFLHDGRARSLLEAVLWHGGEAEASRRHVKAASKADRDALVAYLESR